MMKNLILTLLLLNANLAWGSDCPECPPPDLSLPQVPIPEWPLSLIDIEKVDYPRNAHASYCKRPTDVIDTIVFHHSETPSTTTPMQINQMHLNRGTPSDPWLMVAYSYQVNTPYPGAKNPVAKVTEGRPIELVGAHAGSNAFVPMDQEQKKIWDEGQISCGVEGGQFDVDPKQVNAAGNIKANVTTIGVVVIGNYAPFSRNNPNGYRARSPRTPTAATIDMLARLSCQIQKKYPRVKNLKWHNYYQATTCPGNIKNYIGHIKTQAKRYGCEFN